MARLVEVLADHGVMAIVDHAGHRPPLPVADELIARGLFHKTGEHRTLPLPYAPDDAQPMDVVATVVWGRPIAVG